MTTYPLADLTDAEYPLTITRAARLSSIPRVTLYRRAQADGLISRIDGGGYLIRNAEELQRLLRPRKRGPKPEYPGYTRRQPGPKAKQQEEEAQCTQAPT